MPEFLWPTEIERHITSLVRADEAMALVKDLKATLRPHNGGSTDNAFFRPNGTVPPVPIAKNREVHARIPSIMVPFYETYPDTVEFCSEGGLTFLSEAEMLAKAEFLPKGLVDMAIRYVGMGHVMVHTYDKEHDCMISYLDGGANGYDREDNSKARRHALSHYAEHATLPSPKDDWGKIRPYQAWWEAERVSHVF